MPRVLLPRRRFPLALDAAPAQGLRDRTAVFPSAERARATRPPFGPPRGACEPRAAISHGADKNFCNIARRRISRCFEKSLYRRCSSPRVWIACPGASNPNPNILSRLPPTVRTEWRKRRISFCVKTKICGAHHVPSSRRCAASTAGYKATRQKKSACGGQSKLLNQVL